MTATRRKTGPGALRASAEARRAATVVLEVLTGLISPTEATEALSISLPRYYALETRALQGFLTALEPRPRGRQKTAQSKMRDLEREVARLARELARTRSLVRVAHRTIGIQTPAASTPKRKRGSKTKSTSEKAKKPARRRRGIARGEKVAKALAPPSERSSSSDPPGKETR